jgi:hypothetical protein
MDATELDGQLILIEWAGLRAGKIFALVQLGEYEQFAQEIVEIDPDTGEVIASHPVQVSETRPGSVGPVESAQSSGSM